MTNTTTTMTVAIAVVSLASVGLFAGINSSDVSFKTLSFDLFQDEQQLAGVIQTANGYFAVPGYIGTVEASNVADEMFLTDESGQQFTDDQEGRIMYNQIVKMVSFDIPKVELDAMKQKIRD